jgi:hypothetical protein
METLTSMLEQATESLPEGTSVSPEQVLIARYPRRELRHAMRDAHTSADIAQVTLEAAGEILRSATDGYLAVTPSAEYIEGATSGSTDLGPSHVPTADELKIVVGDNNEESPASFEDLGNLFADAGRLLRARRQLETARASYVGARESHLVAQTEVQLANRTRKEASRLSRIPQAIIGIAAFALLGVLSYQSETDIHVRAREIIASGTVHPGTKRYNALEGFASDTQYILLEGFSEGGAAVAGIAAWWAASDRLARPRARIIVRRAVRKASSDT